VAITYRRCGVRRRNADRRRAGVRGKLGAARGYTGADHLRDHVYWVQRATSGGVKLIGYNYWSLTDNDEWGSYRSRFCLYTADAWPIRRSPADPPMLSPAYQEITARRRSGRLHPETHACLVRVRRSVCFGVS
jgi:hypothetical protein